MFIKKPLNTKVIYPDPIASILNHIDKLGLQIYDFKMKITRFDISYCSKYTVQENRIDANYGRCEYKDHAELTCKLKMYFISNTNRGMCVTCKMIATYPNMFSYDMYVKSYIYTYMKALIEHDSIIRSMYPGGKIDLPDDIYKGNDIFGLNQTTSDTEYDMDTIVSVISDK